jgi:hypothetical protein
MMQFTALSLMGVLIAWSGSRQALVWIRFSAVAAGWVCGSKYQGGMMLWPVLLTGAWYIHQTAASGKGAKIVREILLLGFLFALSYIFTTPGTLWDPVRFFLNLSQQINRYQTGHVGYTVQPGAEHLSLMAGYLALVAFSKYPLIALFFFILTLAGIYAVFTEESRWKSFILLSFLAGYLFYMSLQRIMIVRNILVVIPYLSVLSARGFTFLWNKLPKPAYQRGFLFLVVLLLSFNALWLLQSGLSIKNRSPIHSVGELARYLDRHTDEVCLVSGRIAGELRSYDGKNRGNITELGSEKTRSKIFHSSEVTDVSTWLANRFNYITRWFGPSEVNLNYYPTWLEDHIVIMPVDSAKSLK